MASLAYSRRLAPALVVLLGAALVAIGTSDARSQTDATLPYTDNFTAGDGSPLSDYWTYQAGQILVSSNQAVGTGAKVNLASLNGATASDVSVQADVAAGQNGSVGVVARYVGPAESSFYVGLLTRAGSKVKASIAKKLASGGYKTIAKGLTLNTASGTLQLIAFGPSLKLLLNNQLVAYAQDVSLGSGQVGIRADKSEALDNFSASTQPSSNATLPFSDSFSSPGPGSQLPTTWTDELGDVTIVAGEATGVGSKGNVSVLNGLAASNIQISAPIALTGKQSAGLVARYSGPLQGTFYLGRIEPYKGGFRATIWKCVAGQYRELAAGARTPDATGSLEFNLSGSSLQLLLGATPLVSVTDSSIASPGSAGLWLGPSVAVTSFTAQ